MKRTPVVLGISVLFSLGVVIACSSESGSGSSSGGGGGDAGGSDATNYPDVGKVDSGGKADSGAGPKNYDECATQCEAQHPSGAAKSAKIDQCWEAKCPKSCAGVEDGGADSPGADGGKCKETVDTGDGPCDACTNANCCAEWDGCFGDKDCSDFDTCLVDCDAQFPE
jgi:hypothetical protein